MPDVPSPKGEHAFGRLVAVGDEPGHIDGCRIQMIEKDGREVLGIYKCVGGCPFRQRGIDRGQQLARERGWISAKESSDA